MCALVFLGGGRTLLRLVLCNGTRPLSQLTPAVTLPHIRSCYAFTSYAPREPPPCRTTALTRLPLLQLPSPVLLRHSPAPWMCNLEDPHLFLHHHPAVLDSFTRYITCARSFSSSGRAWDACVRQAFAASCVLASISVCTAYA